MALLLCSRNENVLQKWCEPLKEKWQIHQAVSINELESMVQRFQIDTILLHRTMIDTEQLQKICAVSEAGIKIFVFSDRPSDQEGMACLQFGCVGYANTYITPVRLVAAVEAVQNGLVWVGTSLMQYLIKGLARNGDTNDTQNDTLPENPLLAGLSKREYQIARLVADGLPNGEIAAELNIKERTVKAHLSSIYAKTRTRGRLNLALLINTQ